MKIAILSDVHDNIWKLDAALTAIGALGAESLLCCGDLCAPFILPRMAAGFAGPIHVVFGNNDGDRYRIAVNARPLANVTLHGELAELELGGRRFALHHFDDVGRLIAEAGRYDVVCCGHNHRYEVRRIGQTLLINPGEIMGRDGSSTFVLYDTETGEATRHEA